MPWVPVVRTGKDSGKPSSKAAGKASSKDCGNGGGKNLGKASSKDSGNGGGKAAGKASSKDSGNRGGKNTGKTSSKDTAESTEEKNVAEDAKRKATVWKGEHCEVTKHSSMGCAIVTMQEVCVREAILRAGSELSIADVRVQLKPHFAKETGEEVTTGVFVLWGRQVEKATPLSEADLASFFDQRRRELVAGGCLADFRKGAGKDAGKGSAEHGESAEKTRSTEDAKGQASVRKGEHCEVRKHSSMSCAIVTMHAAGVRQAILREGSEVSIANVCAELEPHVAKETGEEVATDLLVSWSRRVEKMTPSLSETDLVNFFDRKHMELVARGCVEKLASVAPAGGAPAQNAAAPQMPAGTPMVWPMGAPVAAPMGTPGAPIGAPLGMPAPPRMPAPAPLGMPAPPRMLAPVRGPLPPPQAAQSQEAQRQQQAMMHAAAQRQWAMQMQAWSMMMHQQQQQQQAMASAAMEAHRREEDADAKCEQLKRERDRATGEFVAALAENARLREEIREMRASMEALEAAAEAMASQPCDCEVEAWRQGRSSPKAYQQPHLVRAAKKALKELAPKGHGQECARMRGARVTAVRRVANTPLWSQYQAQKAQIAERIRRRQKCPSVAELAPGCAKVQELFPHIRLDPDANEVLLLHGCPTESIPYIVEYGFDERLSKRGGALYGNGVYFTFESCKAAQYSGPGTEGTLILARVILGHPFQAEGPLSQLPMLEEYNTPYDSTIARPGISKGKGKGGLKQKHWEFVVQRGCLQAYPELLIDFVLES